MPSNITTLEQIRAIEEQCGKYTLEGTPASTFTAYLNNRAKECVKTHNLEAPLQAAAKLCGLFIGLCCAIIFAIGATAIIKAVSITGDTLNVFWVLIILLGFNIVSLTVWAVLMLLPNRKNQNAHVYRTPISRLFSHTLEWLCLRLAKECPTRAASKQWLAQHLEQKQGAWFLSQLTHGFWLLYLLGGALMLFLVLATKQYNFVWGSTLLDESVFFHITQTLAMPMQYIHWPTPSSMDVSLSQQGAASTALAQTRANWAYFLLGCLFFYGIIPRAIAWWFCKLQRTLHLRKITLNMQLPYYLQLHNQWQAQLQVPRVLDADTQPAGTAVNNNHESLLNQKHNAKHQELTATSPEQLPQNALWIGIELPNNASAQLHNANIINATNKNTVQAASIAISQAETPVLFLVDARKPPDRGLTRLLKNLMSTQTRAPYWLVCLQAHEQSFPHAHAWQALAVELGIPQKHCLLLEKNNA